MHSPPKKAEILQNTTFQVLSRSPESGSKETNSTVAIRKYTVYQHCLELANPIRDVRRVLGDRKQLFGPSLNLTCFSRRAGQSILSSG